MHFHSKLPNLVISYLSHTSLESPVLYFYVNSKHEVKISFFSIVQWDKYNF